MTHLTLDSTIHVSGTVKIENGDTVVEYKNKTTMNYLKYMLSMIGGYTWSSTGTCGWYAPGWYQGLDQTYVVLGLDQTHVTTNTTSALTAPIGTSPGTKPNSSARCTSQNGNNFYMTYSYTWQPGVVTGIVGEIGHYFATSAQQLITTNATQYCNGTSTLNSRVCVADGEMSPFTIDPMKPLLVTWTYEFTADGKFLNSFVYNLINAMIAYGYNNGTCWCTSTGNYPLMSYDWAGGSTFMVVGQDTTHGNNIATTTALYNPIGTSGGTRGNSRTLSIGQINPDVIQLVWNSTWNPGTLGVGNTLGEIGIYLGGMAALQGFGFSSNWNGAYLAGRMNVSDGHFVSSIIDSTKPLAIGWTITFTWV
jgi:hypothetical protein